MKLSMWMIANRLSPLMDISVNIRPDAKPILNSARVAYSTNTAHVYQSGKNVIVEGEGDQILLYEIKLKEAFEIIQGVFDYYQDWEAEVEEAVARGDYQHVIDCCWLVFSNPMTLMDGNNRLLAITRDPGLGEMDPEWDYLCKYGYSSISGEITNAEGTQVSTETGTVSVSLDETSTWILTADTYITEFSGNAENVIGNGYTLYVNGTALEGIR